MKPAKSKITSLHQAIANIPGYLVPALARKHGVDKQARTFLPRVAVVRSAAPSDAATARGLCAALKAGEIAVFDKAYVDFKHLSELTGRRVLRVTRPKANMSYGVVEEFEIKNKTVILDAKIELLVETSRKEYPECLRLVVAEVVQDGKTVRMEFITGDFSLAAATIADLYKTRRDVELFFKQIKRTLQLSDFLGYSENVVWTMPISSRLSVRGNA
jgi:hypothetical protein